MKTWISPDVKLMDIEDTTYGGEPSNNFDNSWFDQNGALHVNFEPTVNPS